VPEHLIEADAKAVALVALTKADLAAWRTSQAETVNGWIDAAGFSAEAGAVCLVPDSQGRLDQVLFGLAEEEDAWAFAPLPAKLPPGCYRLTPEPEARTATRAALAWSLATYSYDRYKSRNSRDWPKLVWPQAADRAQVDRCHDATSLTRDLINTPAADLGPAELASAAETLAARFGATCKVTVGDGLLVENYPAIHAVGRAATTRRRPRLSTEQYHRLLEARHTPCLCS